MTLPVYLRSDTSPRKGIPFGVHLIPAIKPKKTCRISYDLKSSHPQQCILGFLRGNLYAGPQPIHERIKLAQNPIWYAYISQTRICPCVAGIAFRLNNLGDTFDSLTCNGELRSWLLGLRDLPDKLNELDWLWSLLFLRECGVLFRLGSLSITNLHSTSLWLQTFTRQSFSTATKYAKVISQLWNV